MSEYEELSENTEHAKEPFDKKVAVTMAIIAAALAIVSVLGQIFATEELLTQQQSSDQWAFYQAKSIRRYESDIARDVLRAVQRAPLEAAASRATLATAVHRDTLTTAAHAASPVPDDTEVAKEVEKYGANVQRYEKEGEEIQAEAQKLSTESKLKGREALRLHMGEVFLEIGIVFASLAILTKRRMVWSTSIVSACVGVGIALTAALVR